MDCEAYVLPGGEEGEEGGGLSAACAGDEEEVCVRVGGHDGDRRCLRIGICEAEIEDFAGDTRDTSEGTFCLIMVF